MGYSRAKAGALLDVLKAEQVVLDERIRAVVFTDYEKTSAVTAEIAHLLDEEAGAGLKPAQRCSITPRRDSRSLNSTRAM